MSEDTVIQLQPCANCGTELNGLFCSNCGQAAKSRRGPIWQVTAQFADDIFSIDSKVLTSLVTLLIKPGLLSARFLDGKRASVLPPVRLYLVISLLFFFVFAIPSPDVSNDNVYIGKVLLGRDKPIEGQFNFNLVNFDAEKGEENIVENWLNGFIESKRELLQSANPQVTIDRMFNSLEDILPNILILFLPLFALVLKMLYLFKRVLYFDHLIFSLHFQTWLMGAVLIIYALALQNAWWSALSLLIPIYLARAQKIVYKQTYWLVIPKTIMIIVIYLALILIAGIASFLSSIALL